MASPREPSAKYYPSAFERSSGSIASYLDQKSMNSPSRKRQHSAVPQSYGPPPKPPSAPNRKRIDDFNTILQRYFPYIYLELPGVPVRGNPPSHDLKLPKALRPPSFRVMFVDYNIDPLHFSTREDFHSEINSIYSCLKFCTVIVCSSRKSKAPGLRSILFPRRVPTCPC